MKRLLQGNEATLLGAVAAGADFFAGYPITPSNEVMAAAAQYASTHTDFTFLQMEDEIASIAAVVGGSMAGAKAFTATSGPGFSLMQENIGLAYMTATPLVVVNVQRVGPSTGMPTYPAQGDLLQAKHGSHGDYTAVVLAPNSVAESYLYTVQAFNIAEAAQTPVIVLSDGFVGHLEEVITVDKIKIPKIVPRQRPPLGSGRRHFTGLISDAQGIPKTADPKVYQDWYWRRQEQIEKVAAKHSFYEYVPNPNSDSLLISYGIVSRVITELQSKFGFFRPIRLFPFLEKELRAAAKNYQKIIVVEASDGQLASEVERVLTRPVKRIPLLGGEIKLSAVKEQL